MSTIRKFLAASALPVVMAAAGPALAANCAPISVTTSPGTLNYDPIKAVAATTTTFTVTFGPMVVSSDANVRLIFTDSATGTPIKIGSSGPQYSILAAGGGTVSFVKDTVASSQTGVALISAPSGSNTKTATYTVSLPVNSTTDFVGGTSYTENLGYSLQCYKANGTITGTDASTSLTTLNSTITNVLSVITASPQTLDFGNFTSASQTLQVGLKSTNSINVSVSTQNSSTMVLSGATAPFTTSNSIPYTMTFNGAALSSSGTNNVSRASVTGSTYPFIMSLTGGVPSGKLSGTYSDVITLTFTPGA